MDKRRLHPTPQSRLLSIVVPCLNEEDNLESSINRIFLSAQARELSPEVIIVDDGSTDQTFPIAKRLAEENKDVKVIQLEQNRGIGRAFWEGVKAANNEFVVMLPGDDENDPDEVFRYVSLLEHVDLIVPFVMNTATRSLLRRTVSRLYRFIVNISFGTDFNYTNGTVIYNRSALLTLNAPTNSFFFQTELVIRLSRNYLYAEVPHYIRSRSSGRSTAIGIRSLFRVSYAFFKLLLEMHILRKKGHRLGPFHIPNVTRTFKRMSVTQRDI